jgi:death on curing protein
VIYHVTIEEVQHGAIVLARQFMAWNEPIPDFETRYPGRLESCLSAPFQTFSQKDLYKGLPHKAAILFYLMVKNHPFENGNKRIAVMALLLFLSKNRKWLRMPPDELYKMAVDVAQSKADYKDEVTRLVQKMIHVNLVNWIDQ